MEREQIDLTEIIRKAIPQMKEGDFKGEDGLIYCGVCHEPKQERADLSESEFFFPSRACRCEREKKEREEASRKAAELEITVSKNRAHAFPPNTHYREMRFECDNGSNPSLMKRARKYVDDFDHFKSMGKGLLLYGGVGTGKTFVAACIANAILDKGYPVIMTTVTRIINRLQSSFEGRNEYYDMLSGVPLLIIDDLKAERHTEFANEVIFNVIDGRYNSRLPLIVTTNMGGAEIKKTGEDLNSDRINSRLLEICHPEPVVGVDQRRNKLKADYEHINSILDI